MDAAIAISIMARGRHHPVADPWPDIQLIQRIEQFQRSWFQGEASLGDHPKMAHTSFLELIDGECLAEVGQEHRPALRPRHTDHPLEISAATS